MHNNVVIAIQRHFLNKGYVTVCFNFRGCGNSKGRTSWTAMPERADYASVVRYLLESEAFQISSYPTINQLIICVNICIHVYLLFVSRIDTNHKSMQGYSFGAMIANSVDPPTSVPSAKLLVSLPLGVMWALATTKSSYFKNKGPQTVKLLSVYGDRDQFTRSSSLQAWDSSRSVCVPGADHFWMGFEEKLIDQIEQWRVHLTK